jgi:hypothetical protein
MIGRSIKKILRITTAFVRIKPDFLIIGAARSGTTSLFKYLNEHPQTLLAQKKEPNYFSFNYGFFNTIIYKSIFPTLFEKIFYRLKNSAKVISGEASTYYLFYPHTPERVFKKYPLIKVIILIRNPVDRAFSHYKLNVKLKRENNSFEDAINDENLRIGTEIEKLKKNKRYDSQNLHFYSYLERGKYYKQIVNWLKYFPEDQVKIVSSEDFFSNPQVIYSEILRFLEIADHKLKANEIYSKGTEEFIKKETRRTLNNYFKESNQKVFDLLKKDNIWNTND